MNLWFLARDGERSFYKPSGEITTTAVSFGPAAVDVAPYNGLSLAPGASIRLPQASRWYPISKFQTNVGWIAASAGETAELCISFEHNETTAAVSKRQYKLGRTPIPILLPIKPDGMRAYDLVISAPETNVCAAQLGVMENIKHDGLYRMAQGHGIEIGPGPNPRIKPSDTTNVTYLERYGKEEYLQYNKGYESVLKNPDELWNLYRVGSAHQIPDDLGHLDFIFSSHMIEHLPNPLGHFKLWHSRLNKNGLVLGIVPALRGCFDFMYYSPTQVSEWVALLESELSRPNEWQYTKHEARFGRTSADMAAEDIRPHFSFFTEDNLAAFLVECCERFGYADYWVRTGVNNVSIEFGLCK